MMKIEIEKDFPQYFKPAYPEEFELFSHFEVTAGIPTVLFAVTTWKENGKPNVCFHSWSCFHGDKTAFFAVMGKQDQRQSDTDHERRNSVDFHNLTQANLKQPQDKAWLLIKRIGQQAVIAVHKKRLCKVRATVDSVHYKYKVRKPSHHDFVNDGFFFGQQIDACQHGGDKESGTYRIVLSVTYVVCFALMRLRMPIMIFGIMTIVFCVLYSIVASILVYRLAPKTFRLRT